MDLLALELKVWVLGPEPRSSAKAASALNTESSCQSSKCFLFLLHQHTKQRLTSELIRYFASEYYYKAFGT